jgi:hypothetical protein
MRTITTWTYMGTKEKICMISKSHTVAGALLLALSCGFLVGCSGGSEASAEPVDSEDQEVRAGSCTRKRAIQEKWEELLIEITASEITSDQLPAAALTFHDTVEGSDQVAYKANVGTTPTFAVTYWPNNTDEILGEVVIFYPSGARAAEGYWRDSPQIYWRGRCN